MREYRSRWGLYTRTIFMGRKRVRVRFTGLADGGSYLRTDDRELQEALENSESFGKDYAVYGEIATEKAKEVADEAGIKQVEDVKTIMEAREYLKKEGIDFRKLNSPNSVLKQAKEIGVAFPNLIM